ncbi:CgeB family protein [Caloramator sp. E03]|uniref:CgeB family protein n=1 Tax=Caloramator sp. E03 TaxID=2576307 RepID=UPI00143DCA73|nr:glycosyltransferase [Caloramator sp. E03]
MVKIAAILDEFSYICFKEECDLIYLSPSNWKSLIQSQNPQIFFMESIWYGINGDWRQLISGTLGFKVSVIEPIIDYCKRHNIKTVFWNKEDPIHFSYFIDLARLFDYVFTTDADCIPKYVESLNHTRVYVLPFAAQPKIHNPINRLAEKLGQIAFAGSYHSKGHDLRNRDMEIILKPALKYDLSIYDRNFNNPNPYFHFPKDYEPYIKGSLPYIQMVQEYKKYYIFLNVNSIQNSPTMFSRRVFELLACGTNVVSGYSKGIENMFLGLVLMSKNKKETEENLNKLLNNEKLRDRLSLLGQREIFSKHTYRHRLNYILDKIGVNYLKENSIGVTVISCASSLEEIYQILENYKRQLYKRKELILLIKDYLLDIEEIKNIIRNEENIKIKVLNTNESIYKNIDNQIPSVSCRYISIFHPLSYYGEYFLWDLMNVFQHAKAQVAGKGTYFAYLEKYSKLILSNPNNEYRYTDFVNPFAAVIDKDIFKKVKFDYGLNTKAPLYIQIWAKEGIKMYSSDKFNYAYIVKSQIEEERQKMHSIILHEIEDFEVTSDYRPIVTV